MVSSFSAAQSSNPIQSQASVSQSATPKNTDFIVIPGQVIASAPRDASEFLRGHGTFLEHSVDQQEHLIASVVGRVERVNKLLHVQNSAANVYNGHVGDLVVGRIVAVAATRWKVQLTGTSRFASLPLSGVHLPGGIQRVRTAQDARDMSQWLAKGDLVSAEVHKVQNDGTLMLHTRSHRYGKLENGCVLVVPPALVARRKNHYATLLGFDVLWGCNGMIWMQRKLPETSNTADSSSRMLTGQQELAEQQEKRRQEHADIPYSSEERRDLARLRNTIECFRLTQTLITDDSVEKLYLLSIDKQLTPAQILVPSNVVMLIDAIRVS